MENIRLRTLIESSARMIAMNAPSSRVRARLFVPPWLKAMLGDSCRGFVVEVAVWLNDSVCVVTPDNAIYHIPVKKENKP